MVFVIISADDIIHSPGPLTASCGVAATKLVRSARLLASPRSSLWTRWFWTALLSLARGTMVAALTKVPHTDDITRGRRNVGISRDRPFETH